MFGISFNFHVFKFEDARPMCELQFGNELLHLNAEELTDLIMAASNALSQMEVPKIG